MNFEYILTVFITIITVVDPVGLIPVYLPIVQDVPRERQKKIIWRAFAIALLVSTCFLFAGKYLFKYLNIDFNSLYIVGGILLFLIGLDMIYARPRRSREPAEGDELLNNEKEISVFPLAIPMLSGPGTIATLIMFSSRFNSLSNYGIVFFAMVVAFALAALAMYFSSSLLKFFGKTGLNVLDRVVGIILCALAVQFVTNALISIVRSI